MNVLERCKMHAAISAEDEDVIQTLKDAGDGLVRQAQENALLRGRIEQLSNQCSELKDEVHRLERALGVK